MKGHTIWLTGLSGSGKTTIAKLVAEKLRQQSIPVVILDGDVVRKSVSSDLGYTKRDRDRNITRIADICKIITDNGVINIASVVSPTKSIREYARRIIGNFTEVYIKCSLKECKRRDTKGIYEKFDNGEIDYLVGINIDYEEPKYPEIILNTDTTTPLKCCNLLLHYLRKKELIL